MVASQDVPLGEKVEIDDFTDSEARAGNLDKNAWDDEWQA